MNRLMTDGSGNNEPYSVYKKKRKLYIVFDNKSHFKDKHFKLAGYLD